jgi:predicted  nucleic acid-binding Zn-ribbon protein
VSKEREIPKQIIVGNATIITRRSGKEQGIFTGIRPEANTENIETGAFPGAGTFFCVDCGSQLSLLESDMLPECPGCGGASFRLDSIFEQMQDHGDATSEFAPPETPRRPAWLHEARAMLPGPGRFLAYLEEEDTIRLFEIEKGWTRIGRSAAADIRLDDPSVSRRHALIVSEAPKSLRVLDDRSLNGVHVNGETVEWARLGDGDELEIGAYRLFALES